MVVGGFGERIIDADRHSVSLETSWLDSLSESSSQAWPLGGLCRSRRTRPSAPPPRLAARLATTLPARTCHAENHNPENGNKITALLPASSIKVLS